jgi:hypothetical protein
MFRKLVESQFLDVEGQRYQTHYFEHKTARGARRFSCEVLLTAGDRIILDDDSLTSLQAKVARLAPATVYSRVLAGRRSVAA